jgi:uncharacterized protein
MSTPVRVVRIYINEADHGRRTNLMQEVLNVLHDQHRVQGVTVFRGIAGFGSAGQVHAADILRLTVDLPLVIEFFDEPAIVDSVLPLLDGLVPKGHVVAWDAVAWST